MHKSFLGGSNSLPTTSEVWSGGGRGGYYCRGGGSVQVKCIKLNGKIFERIIVPHHILGKLREISGAFFYPNQVN